MTYEELNNEIITILKEERNKIINTNGRHSIYEKELQNIMFHYAELTDQDEEVLNEATDKNKYYKPNKII